QPNPAEESQRPSAEADGAGADRADVGAGGDVDEELFAEAGEITDLIKKVSLGERERFEGDRLAAAAQQRLKKVQVQERLADRVPDVGVAELKDGVVGQRHHEQGAGYEQIAYAEVSVGEHAI